MGAKPLIKKSTGHTFRRNLFWTFASITIYGACQWALVAAMAKFGSKVDVGIYSYALAITAPIVLGASLNLRQVQATDAQGEFEPGVYVSTRIAGFGVATAILVFTVFILHVPAKVILPVVLIFLARVWDSASDGLYGYMQRHDRLDLIAYSRIGTGLLQILCFGGSYIFTKSVTWACFWLFIVQLVTTFLFDLPFSASISAKQYPAAIRQTERYRDILPKWNLKEICRLAMRSAPLGVGALIGTLNLNMPRYFIEHYDGPSQLGIFSAFWSVIFPAGLVMGAMGQVLAPRMAQAFVDDLDRFRKLFSLLVLTAFGSGIFGILAAIFAGPQIVTLLFRKDYSNHNDLLILTMVAAAIYYVASATNQGLSNTRVFSPQPYVFAAGLIATTTVSATLVPRIGVAGGIWAYIASMTVWLVLFGILLQRKLHQRATEKNVENLEAQLA